jgi:hypothetical protein
MAHHSTLSCLLQQYVLHSHAHQIQPYKLLETRVLIVCVLITMNKYIQEQSEHVRTADSFTLGCCH